MVAKSGGPRIGMLLLVAVTPPAVAYSSVGALLRPKTAAAVGHSYMTRSQLPPAHYGKPAGLRSAAFAAPPTHVAHTSAVIAHVCHSPALLLVLCW